MTNLRLRGRMRTHKACAVGEHVRIQRFMQHIVPKMSDDAAANCQRLGLR